MAKQDYNQMASSIIQLLGGKDNLTFITHCATRLRAHAKDLSKVDEEGLKKVPGVLGVSIAKDSHEVQVIVGQVIEDVYNAVSAQTGTLASEEAPAGKSNNSGKGVLGKFFSFLMMMADIMSPVIPALIAAGLFSVFLMILQWCGMSSDSSTITILTCVQQAVFYFLPIYVGYTSAKKFNTDPIIAMVACAALLHPNWVTLVSTLQGEGQTFTSFFGIPTFLNTYNSSVLQPVIIVWVMSKIDKWLKKVLPVHVRHVLKPFLLLLIISIPEFTVLAPFGGFITNGIYAVMTWVRDTIPWLSVFAIILFSGTIGVFMPGFHMALMPVAVQSIATVGYDDLINIWFYCCTLTPAFIALAVGLKSKYRSMKDVAFPASLSAFFGISEPTVYGINYKIPQLYVVTFVVELISGLIAGFFRLKSYGFGAYSLTNVLLFLGVDKDYSNFIRALILLAIMAVLSFIGVFMTKYDDSVYETPAAQNKLAANSTDDKEPAITADAKLASPCKGTFIAMKDIHDDAIASGALGQCFGIKPEDGNITSPVSGTINSVAPTKHAYTIYGDHGEQVMVHIGIDSMKMNGAGLASFVRPGMHVKAGDKIASYQKAMFKAEHIDDTVVTILLNSKDYKEVTIDENNKDQTLTAKM